MADISAVPEDDDEEDFYDSQSDASQIKTRIVTKYFGFWTKVMLANMARFGGKHLGYFDLYCGPGVYRDGSPSTPVLILTEALKSAELQERLITVFNDKDPEHIEALIQNLSVIPGIDKLKTQPLITCAEVDKSLEDFFSNTRLYPTFAFIDPFGYKGVTLKLLKGLAKDRWCDLILFFSYNRINAALTNDKVEDHIVALFGGKERLQALCASLDGKEPHEREALILDSFAQALKDEGLGYVLPFSFMQPKRKRTSHYIIFVCKDKLGYKVMKEIMAAESSENDQGVASFGYVPAISEQQTPMLFELFRPIEELGQRLLDEYAGQKMTTMEIYDDHNVGTRFILRNYKHALIKLLDENKIETDRKPARAGTFADDIEVTFPPKEKT